MPACRFTVFSVLFLSIFINLPLVHACDASRDITDILPRLVHSSEAVTIESIEDELEVLQDEGREVAADIFFGEESALIQPRSIEAFTEEFDRLIQPASIELIETAAYVNYLRRRAVQVHLLEMVQQSDDVVFSSILNAILVANRVAALLEMIEVVIRQQRILGDHSLDVPIRAAMAGTLLSSSAIFLTGLGIAPNIDSQLSLQEGLIELLRTRNAPGQSLSYFDELAEMAMSTKPVDIDQFEYRQNQIRNLFMRERFGGDDPAPYSTSNSLNLLQNAGRRHLERIRRRARPLLDFLRENNIMRGTEVSLADELGRLLEPPDSAPARTRTYAGLSSEFIVRVHRIDYELTQAAQIMNELYPGADPEARLAIQRAHRSLEVLGARNHTFYRWITGKSALRTRAILGAAIFSEFALMGYCLFQVVNLNRKNDMWTGREREEIEAFKLEVEDFRKTGRNSAKDLSRTLAKLNAEITGLQQLWREAGRKSIDWPEIPPVLDLDQAMFELL